MNAEMLKLIGILGGGILILILGFTVQRIILKKKSQNSDIEIQKNSNYVNGEDDFSNDLMKNYISEYKSSYSRDSIKQGLLNSGQKEDEIEKYLKKYFD